MYWSIEVRRLYNKIIKDQNITYTTERGPLEFDRQSHNSNEVVII